MPERHLKIGAIVKTRLVPTYASFQIGADIPNPPTPQVGYKSAAGHTEYKDAPQDSPEFKAWSERTSQLYAEREVLRNIFTYNYAIESWSWNEGATWLVEPPDDWQFSKQLEEFGIHPSRSRRADYIRYELLKIADDDSVVLRDAIGLTAPITNPEVDAALGGFLGNMEGRSPAGKRRKANR
jgi:hypothetical protein